MALPPLSSLNPFDSDDDLAPPCSRTHSNPLGHAQRGSLSAQDLALNRRSSAPCPHPVFDPANPFDDDEPSVARLNPPKNRSSDAWLDDGLKPRASVAGQGDGQRIRKSSRSQARERGVESGGAALKNSLKSANSEAKQASKLGDGSLKQTQKPEERSHDAFKSTSQSRDRLIASDVDIKYGGSYYGSGTRIRYDDNKFQGADLEYKSVQELEGYALQKSEDTTKSIQNSLKVAESIRGDAERTLITLHEQGEQIRRTHEKTADIDQSLYAGEKLLASLGGMFSKTWKPQKGRPVTGPAFVINDSVNRRANRVEQRVALGLGRSNRKGLANRSSLDSGAQSQNQTTQSKLEMERAKQDDSLSNLSNVLDQLKEMSIDMGSEMSRQTAALDHLHDDISSLDGRMKGANIRGRRLLGHN